MDNPTFATSDDIKPEEKDEPHKQSCNFYDNNEYADDKNLLDAIENNETAAEVIDKNRLKDYTESPGTKLAKFIPEIPFKIDSDSTQLCDSKIFVKPLDLTNGHKSFHVSLSMEEEFEDNEQVYSKSCDCNEDIMQTLQERANGISRSISEDYLQQPSSSLQRRISLVSTSKGRLMGVPRVRPGEKVIRSPSVSGQQAFRPPTRISVVEEVVPIKPKFTTEQKWIAFCLCLVDFTAFLSMSIIAPFFPLEVSFFFTFLERFI